MRFLEMDADAAMRPWFPAPTSHALGRPDSSTDHTKPNSFPRNGRGGQCDTGDAMSIDADNFDESSERLKTERLQYRSELVATALCGAISWGSFGWLLSIAIQSLYDIEPTWLVWAAKSLVVGSGGCMLYIHYRSRAPRSAARLSAVLLLCIPLAIIIIGAFSALLQI